MQLYTSYYIQLCFPIPFSICGSLASQVRIYAAHDLVREKVIFMKKSYIQRHFVSLSSRNKKNLDASERNSSHRTEYKKINGYRKYKVRQKLNRYVQKHLHNENYDYRYWYTHGYVLVYFKGTRDAAVCAAARYQGITGIYTCSINQNKFTHF